MERIDLPALPFPLPVGSGADGAFDLRPATAGRYGVTVTARVRSR